MWRYLRYIVFIYLLAAWAVMLRQTVSTAVWIILAYALGLAVLGVVVFGAYKYVTDEGVKRTMQFSWKEDKDAALGKVHKVYAKVTLQIILQMKGYYIKAYDEELKVLLDDVPPRPTALIKSIIENEFACPLGSIFETFESKCIGAASIGQVHMATLKGSKIPVAVKVQYPEVEGFFRMDLNTVRMIMASSIEGADKIFDEIAESFQSEFDYRIEASNLRVCSDNLEKNGFRHRAVIPKPVDELHPACPASQPKGLCRRRVIVMEALKGVPIKKHMKQVLTDMAHAQGKTGDELISEMRDQAKDPEKLKAMMNAPMPSEFAVRAGLVYMRFKNNAQNFAAGVHNYTLGLGPRRQIEYKWTTIPPNGPKLVRLLYAVHATQIFVDGHFNADPHAGNVIICDDGRLGLVDYGNTPTLTLPERLNFARFIIALADNDEATIIAMFREFGEVATGPYKDEVLLMIAYGDFDQRWGTPFINKRFGYPEDACLMDVINDIHATMKSSKTKVTTSPLLINLQRCMATLNGVAAATGAGNPSPSAMWREAARTLLAQEEAKPKAKASVSPLKAKVMNGEGTAACSVMGLRRSMGK